MSELTMKTVLVFILFLSGCVDARCNDEIKVIQWTIAHGTGADTIVCDHGAHARVLDRMPEDRVLVGCFCRPIIGDGGR
jgi:hypothetical protein